MTIDPIAFDTHRFVKRLVASGMPEPQAEALAEEQVSLLNTNLATKENLAQVQAGLKTDIAQVQAELEAKLAEVRVELKTDIAQVKYDLVRWMVGALMAQTTLTVALIVGLLQVL